MRNTGNGLPIECSVHQDHSCGSRPVFLYCSIAISMAVIILITIVGVFYALSTSSQSTITNNPEKDDTMHYSLPQCIGYTNITTYPKWRRRVFHKQVEQTLRIEASDRASHRILSHILIILLKERLLYDKVELVNTTSDSSIDALDRLSCPDKNCIDGPTAHINAEVWMKPGFSVKEWVKSGAVTDCGPLGPIARWGIFTGEKEADQYARTHGLSLDHWRSLGDPNVAAFTAAAQQLSDWAVVSNLSHFSPDKSIPILVSDSNSDQRVIPDLEIVRNLYSSANMTTFSVLTGNLLGLLNQSRSTLFFANWFPSPVTVQGQYSRITFPDCQTPSSDPSCLFRINQLTKVVTGSLEVLAPQAYKLMKRFSLTQDEYEELLRQVDLQLTDERSKEEQYYRIACDWVQNQEEKWMNWTEDYWDEKETFYIASIMTPSYKSAESKFNLSKVVEILVNSHSKNFDNAVAFQILYYKGYYVECSWQAVLESYHDIIKAIPKGRLLALQVSVCSDSMYPMLLISQVQSTIVISSATESLKYRNNEIYDNFFRTTPSLVYYGNVLAHICIYYNWRRIVILRKNDHFIEKKPFVDLGITVLKDIDIPEQYLEYNTVYKKLEILKTKDNARIFVTHYDLTGTQLLACAATRLQMTFNQSYVWFINPLYAKGWDEHQNETIAAMTIKYNCTLLEIQTFMRRSFIVHNSIPPQNDFLDTTNLNIQPKDSTYAEFTNLAIDMLYQTVKELFFSRPGVLYELHAGGDNTDLKNTLKKKHLTVNGKKDNKTYFKFEPSFNGPISLIWSLFFMNAKGFFMIPLTCNISNGYLMSERVPQPWANKQIPSDGNDCSVDPLNRVLGITCRDAKLVVIFSTAWAAIFLVLAVVAFYCHRRIKPVDDPDKRPYELLCQELLDIDMNSVTIVLNRRVGQGAFGLVYGGEAKRKNKWEAVAVKVITKNTSFQGKCDFLTEAKLMRDLKHPNVVHLFGICLHPPDKGIYLVMEFMLFGDLKTYLLSRRVIAQQNPDHEEVNSTRLTQFALNIASGLAYLHSLGLIHRDIACRNCLVDRNNIVKIGDFGLTRKMKDNKLDGYYRFTRNCELPIRWMSPEAVQFGVFSVQSDMWSYGIVLYEIVTFGVFPYEGMGDVEVVERVKRDRFSIVHCLPTSAQDTIVFDLIQSCCQYSADHRPKSMNDVCQRLIDNPSSIVPFLTDEPPKPATINLNDIPFQHGAGACNLTDPIGRGSSRGVDGNRLRSSVRSSGKVSAFNPHHVYGHRGDDEHKKGKRHHIMGDCESAPQKSSKSHYKRAQSTDFIAMEVIENDPQASTVSAPGYVVRFPQGNPSTSTNPKHAVDAIYHRNSSQCSTPNGYALPTDFTEDTLKLLVNYKG